MGGVGAPELEDLRGDIVRGDIVSKPRSALSNPDKPKVSHLNTWPGNAIRM
jgi:hypothetical protein